MYICRERERYRYVKHDIVMYIHMYTYHIAIYSINNNKKN